MITFCYRKSFEKMIYNNMFEFFIESELYNELILWA